MNCSHCVRSSSNYIAAGILPFLFGPNTELWTSHSSESDKNIHICLRTLQNWRSLPRQPFELQTVTTTHWLAAVLIIMKYPQSASVRMEGYCLWGWWLLWLSTLNVNPQQSTVPHWLELYVLLMMAKFHAWKAGIMGLMKDPVSSTLYRCHPVYFYFLLLLSVFCLVCNIMCSLPLLF